MKGKGKLMGFVTLCILLILFIQIGSASLLDTPITKDGITVTLLENTDTCETHCYSKYEICYTGVSQLQSDLDVSFKNEKNNILEPDDYLDRYEIEMGESPSCRRLTVHGKKSKFQNIDNIPCIKGTCFNEFAWWNTTFLFRSEILFTNTVLNDTQFSVNDTSGINGTIVWTKRVPETMYIYCVDSDCEVEWAIGNETDELNYETEVLRGNNPLGVWDNIVSMWHFSNVVGSNSTDSSINNHNISLVNGPTLNTSGVFNNSFRLVRSTSQYLTADGWDYVTGNGNISMCAWARTNINCGVVGWCRVFQVGQSSALKSHVVSAFSNSDTWGFGAFGDNTDSGITIVQNQWYHVCQTHYDNGTTIGYINGTEVASDTITFDIDTPVVFVGASQGGGNLWDGNIDDVRMWNKTLSQVEINSLFQNGINNLTSEGEQEEFSLTQNASTLIAPFDIDDFVISSTTPETLINISFNTTQALNGYGIILTANCQRLTGLANVVTTEILFDGVITDTKVLCSVNSVGDVTSGGSIPDGALLGAGEHEIAMRFNISSVGSVNISNIDMSMVQVFNNRNQPLDATKYVLDSVSFNNTEFQSVFNFTSRNASSIFPLVTNTSTILTVQFSARTTGIDVAEMYIQNLNSGEILPYGAFSFESADAIRSGSLSIIDTFTDTIPINYSLFARTRNGENITLEGFARTGLTKDSDNGTVNVFRTSNNLTNLTSSLLLNAGENLIMNQTVLIKNSTDMFLTVYVSVNSTSGSQTPRLFINTSNTALCSQKSRFLPSNDAYGWIYAIFMCDNFSVGDTVNFMTYIDVPAGETLRLLDESMSGVESDVLNITELPLPPIETVILEPANNSIVFNSGRIAVVPYFDPNGDTVTYTYALFNKTGTFNKTILANTLLTNISVNWTNQEFGNFDLVVEGCDSTSLCATNISINITIIKEIPCNVTFNVLDSVNLTDLDKINVTCTGYSDSNLTSPFTNVLPIGPISCTFSRVSYNNGTDEFTCVSGQLTRNITMIRIIPDVILNISYDYELTQMPLVLRECISNFTLKMEYQDRIGTLGQFQNTTRQVLKTCENGCDFKNARCRNDPVTNVVIFIIFVILMSLDLCVPLLLITRKTKRKLLKLMLDSLLIIVMLVINFSIMAIFITPIVTFLGAEFSVLVIIFNLLIVLFMFLLGFLFFNNVIKRRYG